MSITLGMLFKNDIECIKKALDSVAGCYDKLIAIDTGSYDGSTEVVSQMPNAEIIFNPVEPPFNYSELRNLYVDKANTKWILTIDTDEYFPKYFSKALGQLINNCEQNKVDVVSFPRQNLIDGCLENFWDFDVQIRLFRSCYRYDGIIHETIYGYKKNVIANIPLTHDKSLKRQRNTAMAYKLYSSCQDFIDMNQHIDQSKSSIQNVASFEELNKIYWEAGGINE